MRMARKIYTPQQLACWVAFKLDFERTLEKAEALLNAWAAATES